MQNLLSEKEIKYTDLFTLELEATTKHVIKIKLCLRINLRQ